MFTIARRDRNMPTSPAKALELAAGRGGRLLVNGKSGRAAVQIPAPSLTLDDGEIERRIRLVRPMERTSMPLATAPRRRLPRLSAPDRRRRTRDRKASVAGLGGAGGRV